ncbi:KH domain-containing protein [Patescibacteria group bacterium]|nr:KH domain-containing protein [Patescibacteria group bacterium]MBU1906827.1 KH domain-containing protein [Patescibacteria group bacterium]
MKHLVETIVKALVDNPEDVEVVEVDGQHSCVLELYLDPSDIGKVIGKRGVHAQAIRTIITAAGGARKKRYVLDIIEDVDALAEHRRDRSSRNSLSAVS